MIINSLMVFGTRPEAIKMAPLIKQFKLNDKIHNKVCVTGQHQQMLDSVLDLFDIRSDFNLQVMSENQDLSNLTTKILMGLDGVLKRYKPNLIIVHGDTTTTFAASLAAYYNKIPIAHVEAGLRTGNIYSPWPEEMNRKLTGSLATIHFAPTDNARLNLLREGVNSDKIHVTGNTIIDALYDMVNTLETRPEVNSLLQDSFSFIRDDRKFILVTGHRRENFGSGFERICHALRQIALLFPGIDIVYPVHLNPNVHAPVHQILNGMHNIHLIKPIDYRSFVYLMKKSYLILTDSGGIQEEAPALGKPVLVMRDTTERPEAVLAGTSKLVGSNIETIVRNVTHLLTNKQDYSRMSQSKNPYGDGTASLKIVKLITQMKIEVINKALEVELKETHKMTNEQLINDNII